MRVLGLDTSTDTGGVAVVAGDRLVGEYVLNLQRTTHSERLLPTVERVLADAGFAPEDKPDAIAVALGPGSFTGLRIGVVTAKTLSYAWDVPVVGVLTLEALALQMSGAAPLACPIMDARNGNVFTALYDVRGAEPVAVVEPALRPAHDWFTALGSGHAFGEDMRGVGDADESTGGSVMTKVDVDAPIIFGGDGLFNYWEDIRRLVGERARRVAPGFELLRTGAVAMLGAARLARGEADDPMQLTPVYLRKSEAERKWEAQSKTRSPS